MYVVALTGGIGSGKSTVAERLAGRGAVVIDADAIVHELQRTGSPLLDQLVERFGPGILRPDGSLDRAALAAIAFSDEQARNDLNDLVHPAVRTEMVRRVLAESGTDHVVVLDIPLLTDRATHGASAVVVVDLPVDEAVCRLVGSRRMDEADARSRIAAQITREERLALADHVVDNSGDLADLDRQLDALWSHLQARAVSG